MNRNEVYALGIRIIGLWLVVSGAALAPMIIAPGTGPPPRWLFAAAAAAPCAIFIAAGLCMLRWSNPIARKLCGPAPFDVEEGKEKEALQHVVFSLAGAVVLKGAVPALSGTIIALLRKRESGEQYPRDIWTNVVAGAAWLAIGTSLLLASGRLARMLSKPPTDSRPRSEPA